MTHSGRQALAKVPAVTLMFWIIKILATTLGETAGDTVSMSMDLGYLVGTAIFVAILILLVWRQMVAERSVDRVLLFWSAFILTRPLGAAVGDLLDKPIDHGGFAFSRPHAPAVLVAAIVILVLLWPLYPSNREEESISSATF
ncbi:hypothetical protein U1701_07405 [Sphingomonas sp. PB2P19]|uniref:hypothetical protein n=1 Tax=Sphingomonas rhamnosi TaxID=3096156 RepID=UPI002FCC5171